MPTEQFTEKQQRILAVIESADDTGVTAPELAAQLDQRQLTNWDRRLLSDLIKRDLVMQVYLRRGNRMKYVYIRTEVQS